MLVHVRTLQLSEDVLSVCYSPDQCLLAVSLLDSTIKVFFADSLKVPISKSTDVDLFIPTILPFQFFLSLYGHKLPVLSMDISSVSLSKSTACH